MKKIHRPHLTAMIDDMRAKGHISCQQAFTLARETGCTPTHLGEAMDANQIRIDKCQLGLFGFGKTKKIIRPANAISTSLKSAIEDASNNNRLECRSAWNIAQRMHLTRITVAAACESMGIKISRCQLGAF